MTPTAEQPADSRHEVRIVNLRLFKKDLLQMHCGKRGVLREGRNNEDGERIKGEMKLTVGVCMN